MSFWKRVFGCASSGLNYKEMAIINSTTNDFDSIKNKIDSYWNSLLHSGVINSVDIPIFLDQVALKLCNFSFNPYDVMNDYNTEEDMYNAVIADLKNNYKNIIDFIPLEILYTIGYKNARDYCFMVEDIFGKTIDYSFDNEKESYIGRFNPKMEKFLIESLGIKSLS
jgi:hypothetical protein